MCDHRLVDYNSLVPTEHHSSGLAKIANMLCFLASSSVFLTSLFYSLLCLEGSCIKRMQQQHILINFASSLSCPLMWVSSVSDAHYYHLTHQALKTSEDYTYFFLSNQLSYALYIPTYLRTVVVLNYSLYILCYIILCPSDHIPSSKRVDSASVFS